MNLEKLTDDQLCALWLKIQVKKYIPSMWCDLARRASAMTHRIRMEELRRKI